MSPDVGFTRHELLGVADNQSKGKFLNFIVGTYLPTPNYHNNYNFGVLNLFTFAESCGQILYWSSKFSVI